jgi:hypothetical protein
MTTSVPVDTLFDLTPDQGEAPLSIETIQRSVNAVRSHKEELESELLKIIREKVNTFGMETSCYPNSIDVTLVSHYFAGDKLPRYLVSNVTLGVSL